MGSAVRDTSTEAARTGRDDWSYWALMAGIAVVAFGAGWLIDWQRPVIAVALVLVGATLIVVARMRRVRLGLPPRP